eukprot:GHVR01156219.1.p1 GENE.GHVR01156219.1~~GHVR01156219.1.p1  ORF type:complete len:284 (+),score=38.62 GHVR01156219.1:64-915(+)
MEIDDVEKTNDDIEKQEYRLQSERGPRTRLHRAIWESFCGITAFLLTCVFFNFVFGDIVSGIVGLFAFIISGFVLWKRILVAVAFNTVIHTILFIILVCLSEGVKIVDVYTSNNELRMVIISQAIVAFVMIAISIFILLIPSILDVVVCKPVPNSREDKLRKLGQDIREASGRSLEAVKVHAATFRRSVSVLSQVGRDALRRLSDGGVEGKARRSSLVNSISTIDEEAGMGVKGVNSNMQLPSISSSSRYENELTGVGIQSEFYLNKSNGKFIVCVFYEVRLL